MRRDRPAIVFEVGVIRFRCLEDEAQRRNGREESRGVCGCFGPLEVFVGYCEYGLLIFELPENYIYTCLL